MSIKLSLGLNTSQVDNCFEVIDYTPPKHCFDSMKGFFEEELFSLPDTVQVDKKEDSNSGSLPDEFLIAEDAPRSFAKLSFTRLALHETDKMSIAETSATTKKETRTVTTSSPKSLRSAQAGPNLSKRSPKKQDWITLQISKIDAALPEQEGKDDEKAFFVNSVFGAGIANERLATLATRVVDKMSAVQDREWFLLSPADRLLLATYLAQIYGQAPLKVPDLESPEFINRLLALKLKGRRNEEKLNKTVKQVNAMIAQSFAGLNHLSGLSEEELAEELHAAYFRGTGVGISVFGGNTLFSQKTFKEAVKSSKYAEDFEAVLKDSYIRDLLASRKQKVLRDIKSLRRRFQEGQLPAAQTEHQKRPPWLLEDIVDGARLCQDIIDGRKIETG